MRKPAGNAYEPLPTEAGLAVGLVVAETPGPNVGGQPASKATVATESRATSVFGFTGSPS